MDNLIESISGFISKGISILLIGGSIAIFAGEVRLAALKKASQGTSSLTGVTTKMTGMRFP